MLDLPVRESSLLRAFVEGASPFDRSIRISRSGAPSGRGGPPLGVQLLVQTKGGGGGQGGRGKLQGWFARYLSGAKGRGCSIPLRCTKTNKDKHLRDVRFFSSEGGPTLAIPQAKGRPGRPRFRSIPSWPSEKLSSSPETPPQRAGQLERWFVGLGESRITGSWLSLGNISYTFNLIVV